MACGWLRALASAISARPALAVNSPLPCPIGDTQNAWAWLLGIVAFETNGSLLLGLRL